MKGHYFARFLLQMSIIQFCIYSLSNLKSREFGVSSTKEVFLLVTQQLFSQKLVKHLYFIDFWMSIKSDRLSNSQLSNLLSKIS